MENLKQKKQLEELRTNEKKWSKPLMAAGWIGFPSVILEKQHALGLTPMDINIILYLATYWWTAENKPHPSKQTIAEALGVHPRTIQRRIAELEELGFIRREERRSATGSLTNRYHFDGLITEATPFALEKIELIKRRKAEDATGRSKKRPTLRLVTPCN